MCSNLEQEIRDAAIRAKSVLGQVGPLVWALHSSQGTIIPTALCVDFEPDEWVAVGTDEPRQRRQERRAQAVRILQELKGCRGEAYPELYTSSGYRDAINRSIVVYAVAALEQFLEQAGKPLYTCKGGKKAWPDSFLKRCERLSEVGCPVCHCGNYKETALLALFRHKIVHTDGKADRQFSDQVREIEKASGGQLGFRLSENGESVIWDRNAKQGFCPAWVGKPLTLAIDEVILPILRCAQCFVAEAEEALLGYSRQP